MEQFEVEEPLNTKKESKQTKNKKSLIKSLSLGLVCIFAIACFYLAITDSALIAHAKDKLGLDKKYPVLIADIGGTNVRLSLLKMSKSIDIAPVTIKKDKLSPKDFKSLDDLFEKYLSSVNEKEYPLYAVIGIPGPVKMQDTQVYLRLKNKEFVIWQSVGTMYPQKYTGSYNLIEEEGVGMIIRGVYDYTYEYWDNQYVVSSLTSNKMIWTNKEDAQDTYSYTRTDSFPE